MSKHVFPHAPSPTITNFFLIAAIALLAKHMQQANHNYLAVTLHQLKRSVVFG